MTTARPADAPRAFVAYCRVSTRKQGESGLSLEAQRAAINAHLRPGDRLLVPVFVEVESGKRADRPELAKALAKCRATGAVLLISKLDRLARNAAFLLGLQASGVEFICCDMPHANRLTIGVMALVAEEEARAISKRTKDALAAAKVRWAKEAEETGKPVKTMGGDRGYRPAVPVDQAKGTAAAAQARTVAAAQAAFRLAPEIEAAKAKGITSLAGIAVELNTRAVPATGGGSWTATAVRRVLARLEDAQAAA